jgi:RNA polymerase sigma-70 factor (ECF subfamily)
MSRSEIFLNNHRIPAIHGVERRAGMTDDGERMIFEKARAGNRRAFDLLHQRLQAPARRFLFRLIGPHAEEEDILRDAFLALYMNLERLPSVDCLRPFLFRVIRNLSYSELRRQGRFAIVSLDEDDDAGHPGMRDLPDPRPSPHDQVQRLMIHNELEKAIDRLPEPQRQALILYCKEDMTYQQIAEAMSTDIGTIKSRIHYARQNLRRSLPSDIAESLGVRKENPHGDP